MYHHDQSSWMNASRPDALLASGEAFLPLTSHQQQQELQSQSTFRLVIGEEEEEPRVVAPPPVRYSAEERRERIDKYRSKRNHRNFQKKITYACRKTLADSRPRVKGRFARGGIGEYDETQVGQAAGISSESPPANEGKGSDDGTSMPEWWPAMQEALATGIDLDNLCCDEEMLAAYLGVSSISLHSASSYPPSASGQ